MGAQLADCHQKCAACDSKNLNLLLSLSFFSLLFLLSSLFHLLLSLIVRIKVFAYVVAVVAVVLVLCCVFGAIMLA